MVEEEEVQKTSLRLPKRLVKRLKQYALDSDSNLTAVIVQALEEFLSKKGGSSRKY
jgi:predicted transcriptional regulator